MPSPRYKPAGSFRKSGTEVNGISGTPVAFARALSCACVSPPGAAGWPCARSDTAEKSTTATRHTRVIEASESRETAQFWPIVGGLYRFSGHPANRPARSRSGLYARSAAVVVLFLSGDANRLCLALFLALADGRLGIAALGRVGRRDLALFLQARVLERREHVLVVLVARVFEHRPVDAVHGNLDRPWPRPGLRI